MIYKSILDSYIFKNNICLILRKNTFLKVFFIVVYVKYFQMNKVIFWYWSLLSPSWWEATLSREILEKDLIYLELDNYKRIWSPISDIKFNWLSSCYSWVFLDIIKSEWDFVNGYWLIVTEEEFDLISRREWTYEMINICNDIKNNDENLEYYTSYALDKYKNIDDNTVIPKKYHDFIEGILNWKSDKFKNDFRMNTNISDFKIKEWDYNFCDDDINFYTGHSNNKTKI